MRPPLPSAELPGESRALEVPLKALSCRNQTTSVMAVAASEKPAAGARLVVGDLLCGSGRIGADAVRVRAAGPVSTPEAGMVMDPVYDAAEFAIERSASLHISITVPRDAAPGTYIGPVSLEIGGREAARSQIVLEVAGVTLPDIRDSDFFLNVWMNPACVARRHGVEMWSDEHFRLMKPYVEDLAAHGQKTAVVPICYQPWGTQTRDPFPNAVVASRKGRSYTFDFSIFDRFVELHEQCGITRAIHCYSLVSGPGKTGESNIEFTDAKTGKTTVLSTQVGDENYVRFWSAFLKAFEEHLRSRGWLEKTYLGFDEKPPDVMHRLYEFLDSHGQAFRTSLAGNTSDELLARFDDLSLHISFNQKGVDRIVPPERSALGLADILRPKSCAVRRTCVDKTITTYYVCCGPAFPNTFLFSPLVESRMLAFLAVQGGYDGFLRWSYNDWTDDPFAHPEWGTWPTGDIFFVYPGQEGPISSLRWEQLREGIYDYDLAMIASASLRTPEDMVDFEQAVSLACRNPDGRTKSVGDIELARRLLIAIAEKA